MSEKFVHKYVEPKKKEKVKPPKKIYLQASDKQKIHSAIKAWVESDSFPRNSVFPDNVVPYYPKWRTTFNPSLKTAEIYPTMGYYRDEETCSIYTESQFIGKVSYEISGDEVYLECIEYSWVALEADDDEDEDEDDDEEDDLED